jgi:beta-lactamase regulating signal transducer with metallopeptidase domain
VIASWLIYASGVGCLIVLVALLLERIARWHNWPARWIWLAAIAGIVALPVALNLLLRSTVASHVALRGSPPGNAARPSLDVPILLLWLGGSLLLTARIVGSALALRRRRAGWIPLDLGTERVLVSDQLGPAVIGWTKLTTVIPRWAFTLDESARALMLQHESEHARAGDPHLRTFALAALVAMPWNPALWWSMRRLRLAVEIDCDRRLLARGVDPQQYASLLLAVGEHMSATPFAWATALGGTRSSLETRILAMSLTFRPRNSMIAIAVMFAIAAVGVALAGAAPVPVPLISRTTSAPTHATAVVTPDSVEDFASEECDDQTRCVITHYMTHRTGTWVDLCPGDGPCLLGLGGVPKVSDRVERNLEQASRLEKAMVGDSVGGVAEVDTVFYRGAKGGVSSGTEPLDFVDKKPELKEGDTEYCTVVQAAQARADQAAGSRFSRRCP